MNNYKEAKSNNNIPKQIVLAISWYKSKVVLLIKIFTIPKRKVIVAVKIAIKS